MAKNRMAKPTHVYIGRQKCGCCCAVVTDQEDKDTARSVAEFIRDGMYVNRVSFEEYEEKISKEDTFMDCKHRDGDLFADQIVKGS